MMRFSRLIMCESRSGGVSAEEDQQRDDGGAELRGAGGAAVAGRPSEGRPERLELPGAGERDGRQPRSRRREPLHGRGEGVSRDGGERAERGALMSFPHADVQPASV